MGVKAPPDTAKLGRPWQPLLVGVAMTLLLGWFLFLAADVQKMSN